jgi:hypothetical protein
VPDPGAAAGRAPAVDAPLGSTPTVAQARRTASAATVDAASAASTVAAANPAKSVSGARPEVSARHYTWPATSQDAPPSEVAVRWNARLGIPELRCTPPLSSVVST